MAEYLCPKCKNPNRVSARFCATCGAPLLVGVADSAPVPSDTVPLPSGTILQGRYRIEGLLGKGGFGAVYRAWDLSLSRLCAVKENLDTSSEAQRQFAREATVLASLNHTNLPRVTDHFIISGQGQYLVMDFVEGQDLISMVERHGLPPVEQTLEWLGEVMDALVYLHSRQPPVVHRDIKPANIRITPGDELHRNGKAMLVDFGLVKASDPHTKTTLGARAVTPGYSPPEQYGQGHTDSRSDIYALGATLYALLTGQDPPESVLRIGRDILSPVEQFNPNVSPAIGRVILRAMSLSPDQRYQTVVNLRSDLNAALAAAPEATFQTPLAPAPPYEPTMVISSGAYVEVTDAPASTAAQTMAGSLPVQPGVTPQPVSAGPGDISTPVSAPDGIRIVSDRLADAVPLPAEPAQNALPAKRKWPVVIGGIFLVGIVLAVVALIVFWGWVDQTSQDEMKQTVDAGVDATRTVWAESTGGVYNPIAPLTATAQAAPLSHAVYSTAVVSDLMNSPAYYNSSEFYTNGDLHRTPTPEFMDTP